MMKFKEEVNTIKNSEQEDENSYKSRVSDVYYTLRPIIILENIYGIFRFRLVNKVLLTPNWKMKMASVILSSAYVILFKIYFKIGNGISGSYIVVDTIDEVPSIVTLVQCITTNATASFLVNVLNIRIINTIAELDTMLHIETFTDFYKKSRSETNKFVLILCMSHLINVTFDVLTTDEITMYKLLILPMYMLQKLEILVFCKLIVAVQARLRIINLYLTTFIERQESKKITVFIIRAKNTGPEEQFNFIGRASAENLKIRELATMYDTIGKICSMINEVFNFQIFMTLVSTFTFIVITIWTSLYYYRKLIAEDTSGELVNVAIWCFSTVYTVAIMSLACERLLWARNTTKVLVNKLVMDYSLPKTMRVQAKAFMELIEAWPLRIFIYDMFSVDITLMLKFVSVATTYLIVIIQISHFI